MDNIKDNEAIKCVNDLCVCKHNEFCGGCIHQEIPYEKQKIMKGNEVLRLMKEKEADLSTLETEFRPEDLVGAPKLYHYRNKMK